MTTASAVIEGEKKAAPLVDLAKQGVLPIVTALAILALVGSACLGLGASWNNMVRDRSQMQGAIDRLTTQISLLEKKLDGFRAEDLFSRQEHLRFCFEAERTNKGWTCPVASLRGYVPGGAPVQPQRGEAATPLSLQASDF